MSLLDAIPGVRYLEAAALAVVVSVVGGVYVKQRIEVAHAHRETVTVRAQFTAEQAAHSRDLALAKTAAGTATIANQSESIRRTEAQKEIDNESQRFEIRARDAAVRAASADTGLRDAFARSAAARGGPSAGNPGAAGFAAPAAPADVVRSDVFGRLDDLAGELAKAFDIAHARGLGCQRAADSLNTGRAL